MAKAIKVTFPSGIEATINPGEPCYPLAQEVERLRDQVEQLSGYLADEAERGYDVSQIKSRERSLAEPEGGTDGNG